MKITPKPKYDVVLVGGGIMSATLATLLHELEPKFSIAIFERLEEVAKESSAAMNNAGTGHSAFCELNYTPEKEDGSIDISKALKICEQYEISKQFWANLVEKKYISSPREFINSCPHLSIVFSEKDIQFLKKRYEKLTENHLFESMEFSENFEILQKWVPLLMKDRSPDEKLAATKMDLGTDVNFGKLTEKLFEHLHNSENVEIFTSHEVDDIDPSEKGWRIFIEDKNDDHKQEISADFVFIGAGGYALPLLDSSDVEESDGYGGFPVSGQWLVSKNPELIALHDKKVYTQASVDAPPMSVPHLDLRIIDGEKSLLFGPFAGFSTKFLKEGSYLDLPLSIDFDNIPSMFGAFIHNLPLTKYLIQQVLLTKEQRIEELRKFVKNAKSEDWELYEAGQRVQIIKKDEKEIGKLEFGTEVVTNKSGTIAAILGASPGASTSVSAMISVLEKCFPQKLDIWKPKIQELIPSYGEKLAGNAELTRKIREFTKDKLELYY